MFTTAGVCWGDLKLLIQLCVDNECESAWKEMVLQPDCCGVHGGKVGATNKPPALSSWPWRLQYFKTGAGGGEQFYQVGRG